MKSTFIFIDIKWANTYSMDRLSIVAYVNKSRKRLRQLILRALQKTMLNDFADTLCHQHTCRGILCCSVVQWIIQIRLFPAAVSLCPRFQQYCTALLMLNGSHALCNPGYKGKIQYSQWEWVKHSEEMINYWVISPNTNWLTGFYLLWNVVLVHPEFKKTMHWEFNT